MSLDVIDSSTSKNLALRQQLSGLSDAPGDIIQAQRRALALKRVAAAKVRSGDLGSILPGFVSTGDALTALENSKAFIDSLDEQIGRAFCKKVINAPGGFIFDDCDAKATNFRIAWNNFVLSYYNFYLEHRSFLSRFADTNSIFSRAQDFAARANQFRQQAIALGAAIADPELKIIGPKNPLDDLMGWLKLFAIVGGVVILAPPLLGIVRSFTSKSSVNGLGYAGGKTQRLAPKSSFDARSFRWIKSGKARILIGCPKGRWSTKKNRCRVGTRAYEIVRPK